ncbi:MAG: membrane-bound lytic murein transglycosylase D [Bacteroidia bacterium]|jgi:membrane-bound lytic murein transglycosylase D
MRNSSILRFMTTALLLVMVFVGFEVFTYSSDEIKTEDENYQSKFNEDYKIYTINIPEKMDFCGEVVPTFDQDVMERLDRELLVNTYWQSNSLLYHKRASKWFPVIVPILKANGIPEDFKYLALVESGLMNVVSPAGASGFWQILKSTAQGYGLEVNKDVDERYNVVRSTEAACKYLNEAFKLYGNWTLAAASYNMGMGGVNKQLKRQKAKTYYDLLLNRETSRYVFRIIAAKEIHQNPTQYGFHYREKDLYKPRETYSITIDTTVSDLALFAELNKINYKILKIFNPWMRQSFLPNKSRKKYKVLFPKSGYYDFSSTELPTSVDSSSSAVDTLQVEEIHE